MVILCVLVVILGLERFLHFCCGVSVPLRYIKIPCKLMENDEHTLIKTLIYRFPLIKVKQLLLKLDLCRSFRPESSAKLSEVVVSHHCQVSVKNEYNWNLGRTVQAPFLNGCNYVPHLSNDAIYILLVHLVSDSVFAQTRRNRAEVVQRCHPEGHLCLLVTELVHLEHKTLAKETNTL